jgi:hypothetical protein
MAKLLATHYRLFQVDESVVGSADRNETHSFGSELVLTFLEAQQIFVSWVNEPVQHSVGMKDTSYFLPDAEFTLHEVSGSRMWAGLVGRDVSLKFTAPDNQILEIASTKDHVLVCSFQRGHWGADELTICKVAPPRNA